MNGLPQTGLERDSMKRKVKIMTDVVMYFIFLYLMSYRAGRGLFLHGILGCFLFVLFVLHHILNGRWYSGLKKGRYRPARIFFVGIDFLLFVAMAGMAVSSVMMSGDIFTFPPSSPHTLPGHFISYRQRGDFCLCCFMWGCTPMWC